MPFGKEALGVASPKPARQLASLPAPQLPANQSKGSQALQAQRTEKPAPPQGGQAIPAPELAVSLPGDNRHKQLTRPVQPTQGPQTLTSFPPPSSRMEPSGPVQAQVITLGSPIQGPDTVPSLTLPSSQGEQTRPAPAWGAGVPLARFSEPGPSDLTEASGLLTKLAGTEVNLQVTRADSRPAGGSENAATTGQASIEPPSALADSRQTEVNLQFTGTDARPARGSENAATVGQARMELPSALADLRQAELNLQATGTDTKLAGKTENAATIGQASIEPPNTLADSRQAEANLQVTGTDAKVAGKTENAATAGQASTEPPSALAGSPQNEFPPANPVASPAKETSHPAPVFSGSTLEGASPKVAEPVVANLRGPLPVAAGLTPTQHPNTTSSLTTPETGPRKEAAAEAIPSQPQGASLFSFAAGTLQAELSDQAASDEGNSGQNGGPSTAGNSQNTKPHAPGLADSTTPNSDTNLLSPQAPESSVSHASTSTVPPPPPASQPSAILAAWQNYEGSAGKIVTSARLNDFVNGAEMHVALRSSSLGPLEVRAIVHEGSVGAEIHVENREAHSLLAASLPSLERALGERDLRVGSLAVYQDHVGGGMSGGEGQNPHSGSSPSPQRQKLPWDTLSQSGSLANGTLEIEEFVNPAGGLSIRA